MEYLEFIETPVFSRRRAELLPDDAFRALQGIFLKTMILAIQSVKLADVKKSAGVVKAWESGGSKSYLLRYNQIGTPLSATGLSQKRKR